MTFGLVLILLSIHATGIWNNSFIFLDLLVVLASETCLHHYVRVNSYIKFQNINKRELYQLSKKRIRKKQEQEQICCYRDWARFVTVGSFLRGCIINFNVFLMVCLSGIWWSCSWEKISWKEGKAIILLSTHALCLPHSHSTLLSRRNTNLWSWFLEHWDLLLNKLTRGELPLWWDNKDDISSPSPLWEQIEGLWVFI